MPGLPEVETARSLVADEALDRRIADVGDSDTFVWWCSREQAEHAATTVR